jgi:hypothetical protein
MAGILLLQTEIEFGCIMVDKRAAAAGGPSAGVEAVVPLVRMLLMLLPAADEYPLRVKVDCSNDEDYCSILLEMNPPPHETVFGIEERPFRVPMAHRENKNIT